MLQKEPIESIFRSLMLVLMDNATAEYTFVTTFFSLEEQPVHRKESSGNSLLSPPSLLSPTSGDFDEIRSNPGSDYGPSSPRRRPVSFGSAVNIALAGPEAIMKEEQSNFNNIWKQIMDPVLEYCKVITKQSL